MSVPHVVTMHRYVPLYLLTPVAALLYLRTVYGIVSHDRALRRTLTPRSASASGPETRHASACDRCVQRCVSRDLGDYWLFKYYRPLLHVGWMMFMYVFLSVVLVEVDVKYDGYDESFEDWATCLVVAGAFAESAGREDETCGAHPEKRLAPLVMGLTYVLIYSWGTVLFLIYGVKASNVLLWEDALHEAPKRLSTMARSVRSRLSRSGGRATASRKTASLELQNRQSVDFTEANVYARDSHVADGANARDAEPEQSEARVVRDVV